jgi:TolB-like protein/DNA-binding winged helix-turn-helix (wHTH) protein/Tfp pilus assembly protein PilF
MLNSAAEFDAAFCLLQPYTWLPMSTGKPSFANRGTKAVENPPQAVGCFQFGVFEVDRSCGEVRKRGAKIKLQEKLFQLLVLLLEHAGETVTREELRRGLWPADTFVDFDANLKTAVNKLRQVLGDSAENSVFIETVPRHGYRFVAPAVQLETKIPVLENGPGLGARETSKGPVIWFEAIKRSSLSWGGPALAAALMVALALAVVFVFEPNSPRTPVPSAHRVVLLVLPFENLGGDPSQDYFSDGLTDEMITLLSRQFPKELAVIARTSAMRYRGTQKSFRQISSELGAVDYVLEGTVRRSGNHVGINAQLFRTQDQASLWAEAYESKLADLLEIQHDVAGRIARSLVLEVVPGRISHSASAPAPKIYDAYLMGLYEANQRSEPSLLKSIQYFRTAIQGDPAYAPAYAELANSYLVSAGWLMLRPADAYPNAKTAALRAVELDENLAEAHTTLAEVEHEYEWKWAGAEREFRRAIELDPNSIMAHKSYAEFLMHGGRTEEAITEMERARDLDPLSLIVNTLVGFAYHNSRQYDRAIEEYEKVIQLNPRFAPAHYFLGASLLQTGRYDEGITHLQTAKTLSGGASLMSAGLARAYAIAGRRDSAQHAIGELNTRASHHYISPYGLAQVYAVLGERRTALDMLNRAATQHSFELMFLKVDRSFDTLREDREFQELLTQIGFPN